jgi:hypothetical protein
MWGRTKSDDYLVIVRVPSPLTESRRTGLEVV